MADTTTITVRIPTALAERLDRLAGHTRRSRSFLAAEAIEGYVSSELEIIESIDRAEADFEAGRVYTTGEIKARLAVGRDAGSSRSGKARSADRKKPAAA